MPSYALCALHIVTFLVQGSAPQGRSDQFMGLQISTDTATKLHTVEFIDMEKQ